MAGSDTSKEDDLLDDAKEAFAEARDHENENRSAFLDDLKFARLAEQWPEAMRRQRELDARPCLTINQLPSYIRRLVNDARQNKPGINVHPVDSAADPETADIINGLIRQIEQSSDAEVAYDTALESAANGGWGYFKINTRYASDDTFDQDIVIEAVPNPLSIYGDPHSTKADSSDWMTAFELDQLSQRVFKRRFKDAEPLGFENPTGERAPTDEDHVTIASWWSREEIARQIVAVSMPDPEADPQQVMLAMALGVSDNLILDLDTYEENQELFQALGMEVMGSPRDVPSYKVTQRILSGQDVLDTIEWAGKFIPIIPVYGEEVNVEGRRHFRSFIRDAKDLQMAYNFFRSARAEGVALSPKVPFIGKKGSFVTDAEKWDTVNTQSWAFIEYDGAEAPQRQPFAGVPEGAAEEANAALADLRNILGSGNTPLTDENESSGRAILARQKQADITSFHFIDNLSRGIRHGGRVIIDLIPKVYSTKRVLRIIGADGAQQSVRIAPSNPQPEEAQGPAIQPGSPPQPQQQALPPGAPTPQAAPQAPQPMISPQVAAQLASVERIYDLTVGKYDLVVKAGPSYATLREELNTILLELVRAAPQILPAVADLIVKTLDIPDAEEVADRIQQMQQAQGQHGDPKAQQQMQQMQNALQQAHGQIQQWQQKAQAAQLDAQSAKQDVQLKTMEFQLKARELGIKEQEAQTNHLQATTDAQRVTLEAQQQQLEEARLRAGLVQPGSIAA